MTYSWFVIFNTVEFEALGLVSKTYSLNLQNLGIKDFLVTLGNNYGITYNDVFLSLNLNDNNPFEFDGYAIYFDTTSNNVLFGIPVT